MGRKSRELAFCGVLSALGTVLVLLGSLLPGSTYCAPILGMLPLLPVLSEFGSRPALGVYGVTAALTMLLVPDRELAGVYLFFGFYPVLRLLLNRIPSRLLRLVLKLAVFNGALCALYTALIWLLGLGALSLPGGGALAVALVAGGNLVFLLLDVALGRLTLLWQHHLRRRLFRR